MFDADASASASEELPEGQTVNVGTFGQIDLHLKDLELTQVLQLLSMQSQRNIVASRNVSGTISADLYGVDFYEALDAILHTNGYAYREEGSFIYVYTAQELAALEDANRKLSTRIVRLNYITADDASIFIQPLLSASGSVALNGAATPGMKPSVSDAGANSYAHGETLMIRDYAENVEEIMAIIEQMDRRPKQVMIEATVLQASMNEANAFGTDLSILADFGLDSLVGSPLNVVDTLISGNVVGDADTPLVEAIGTGGAAQTTVGNTATGPAGVKFGILNEHIAAFVRALDRVTDTTIIAKPKLLVLNRQRAELLVGQKLGYLSTTATETSTTQTVEFLEVGTKLSVRPFISEDGFVRMELQPSVSDGFTSTVSGVVIPTEITNELTTNVIVRSGQTVILGGLFKEDTTVERNQVPYLGDVPLLGSAFKGHDDRTDRSEVIFMITPTIVKDESLYAAGDAAAQGVEMVRLGAREGLLPWSRSKLTSSHLQNALQWYDEGDDAKALWWANMALHLDPGMREALELKEEITGQRPFHPERSVLKDAVSAMVAHQLEGTAPMDTEIEMDAEFELEPEALDRGAETGDDADAQRPVAGVEATDPAAQVKLVSEPSGRKARKEPALVDGQADLDPFGLRTEEPLKAQDQDAAFKPVQDQAADWEDIESQYEPTEFQSEDEPVGFEADAAATAGETQVVEPRVTEPAAAEPTSSVDGGFEGKVVDAVSSWLAQPADFDQDLAEDELATEPVDDAAAFESPEGEDAGEEARE